MENDRMTAKTMQIRNSTVDFLVFTKQNSQDSIEVRVQDENVWLTQEEISRLFDKGRSTITEHLNAIFAEGELNEDSVCRKFRLTAADGKSYNTKFYNLDAIISVGYRVNSIRATQFRQWATKVLRTFAVRGYVLDKSRLETGDMYSMYLGEPVPVMRITTSANTDKKLLVVKDSFADCFIPFLLQHYSEITVVDPSVMSDGMSKYVDADEYEQTLFLFGIDSLGDRKMLSKIIE